MSTIYLIPGLGADTRVYNNINLDNFDVICVDWILPEQTDTLSSYAQRVISQYHIKPHSIVIGNSLGGMIAIEIAKTIPLKKTILISSIKTVEEAPRYFSFFRTLPVYQLIPGNWFRKMDFVLKPLFGHMDEADSWLFRDMLKSSSPVFLKWAMRAIVKWDNKIIPANVVQITGDKDLLFPFKRIPDAIIIKGGTHIMIFERAKEINQILKKFIK